MTRLLPTRARPLLLDVSGLGRALASVAVWSVVGLGATAAAFTLIAQVVSQVLLGATPLTTSTILPIAALLLLRAVTSAARERVGTRFAAHAVHTWRARLTTRALALGPVALSEMRGADLTTLDTALGPRLTPYYARFLPGAVHAALAFSVVLGVTAWLDAATAGILLITGPLTVGFLILVGLATQTATTRQWAAHTQLAARLLTLTRALPTLHAFGAAAPYRRVLERSAARHRDTTLGVLRIAFLSGFVMDFAATLATALVAVWIGVRLFGGEAALAPTLAALMLVPEFFGPLRQLGTDRHAALDAEPVADQLQALLARPAAPSGPGVLPPGVPHLHFRAARARLDTPTVPLTLDLAPGSFAALRGPSGSGKTSLLHALHQSVPYDGVIEIGGMALGTLDRAQWHSRVAFVPQHPRLIAATLRDNLRLGCPHADDPALWSALCAVGLRAVAAALPQGLATPLGEGGAVLSGGETARLALARALLSGADVILLDEPTAHLDAETEAEVLAAIRFAFVGRTVLMATHRAVPHGWRDAPLGDAL